MDSMRYSCHSAHHLVDMLWDSIYDARRVGESESITEDFKVMVNEIRERLETLEAMQSVGQDW